MDREVRTGAELAQRRARRRPELQSLVQPRHDVLGKVAVHVDPERLRVPEAATERILELEPLVGAVRIEQPDADGFG